MLPSTGLVFSSGDIDAAPKNAAAVRTAIAQSMLRGEIGAWEEVVTQRKATSLRVLGHQATDDGLLLHLE